MKMAIGTVLLMVAIVSCLSSFANAAQGLAVYYPPRNNNYLPSKCYGYQDNGWMVAGVSDALWNNGAACGRRYRVRCIGGANAAPHPCKAGSVVVKVVDYCRSVCYGDINLSQYAFSQIADVNAGKVRIEYYQV